MSIQPKLTIVDTEQGINELKEYLKDKEYVAYDCETTGLSHSSEVIGFSICADESEAFYILTHKWNSLTSSLERIIPHVAAESLVKNLQNFKLIMHNSVFDCAMAENYYKVRLIDSLHTDTMVLAHLLNENRKVGLKELAKEMFGDDATTEQLEMRASVIANGGKLTKTAYEMYKADGYIMAKYGAKDAWLTYRLFNALVPELFEQNLDQFFYEQESMPLLRGPTYQLNTSGLKVDQQALLTLKKTLEVECLEAKDFIYKEIYAHIKDLYPGTNKKNTFNIGSNQQLSWLLFGKLELEFNTLTDAGLTLTKHFEIRPYTKSAKRDFIAACQYSKGSEYVPSLTVNGKVKKGKKVKDPWCYIQVDKKTLHKLAPKYKWIEKLLEYQRKMKILNTYVKGIEQRTQYGIIRPSFLQHGTTSGRYASRNPNFQNLPRDDKRIKSCIIARPNRVFVGSDYSQLEPRVFAFFSSDTRLLLSFTNKSDFYSVIGMEVYDKTDCTPQKEGSLDAFGVKYKKLRDQSKVIALASTYGATAKQLAPTTGKSIEDTQLDIDNYFDSFPGVKKLMIDSHEIAKKTGQVTNLFGRPRRMPEAKLIKGDHEDLPYAQRNTLNLAVNHRIQSTGASIVNRSAIAFDNLRKQIGIDCTLVLQVHDSLIVECKTEDAETVALLLQEAMENTVHLEGIRLEAIPKQGKNLSEV